jgi:hypothetical protein
MYQDGTSVANVRTKAGKVDATIVTRQRFGSSHLLKREPTMTVDAHGKLSDATVGDEALRKLTAITKIGPGKETCFHKHVRAAVREIWALHIVYNPAKSNQLEEELLFAAMFKLEKSFLTLIKAASAFIEASAHLLVAGEKWYEQDRERAKNREADVRLLMKLSPNRSKPASTDDTDSARSFNASYVLRHCDAKVLACVDYLVKLKPNIMQAQRYPKNVRGGKGRPHLFSKALLTIFTTRLLDAVSQCDGNITFHKSRETNGVRALRLVAPFLPLSFPREPSLDSVADAFRDWKNKRRQP